MTDNISAPSAGHYEPALTRVFLPRCARCWEERGVITPHPRAFNPRADDICPVCGAPSVTGQSVTVPAVLTGRGPSMLLGRALLGLGKLIRKFVQEEG